MTMQLLSVASEVYPLVKTGGLADVVGALPAALAAHGESGTTHAPAPTAPGPTPTTVPGRFAAWATVANLLPSESIIHDQDGNIHGRV